MIWRHTSAQTEFSLAAHCPPQPRLAITSSLSLAGPGRHWLLASPPPLAPNQAHMISWGSRLVRTSPWRSASPRSLLGAGEKLTWLSIRGRRLVRPHPRRERGIGASSPEGGRESHVPTGVGQPGWSSLGGVDLGMRRHQRQPHP